MAGEGEQVLIKDHMPRDVYAVCGEVKATIAFVITGIP